MGGDFGEGVDPVGFAVEGGTAEGGEPLFGDEGEVEFFDFEEGFDVV